MCVKFNSIALKATLPQFALLSAEITNDHNDLLPLRDCLCNSIDHVEDLIWQ